MPILQDHDVAIWCCRNGDVYQIVEFKVSDPEPIKKFCSKCGEKYVTRCPKKACPHPIYHPSDQYANVHGPCGTAIPWAETRNRSVIVGPGFQSKLLGSGSYMGKSTPTPQAVPELSAQERQDLIVPPSDRATDYSGISPSGLWPKKSIARRRAEADPDEAIYSFTGAVTNFQREKLEKPLQRLVLGLAKFVGASISKGVASFIAKVVEYVLFFLLALLLLKFGLNVSWLQ